MSTKYLAAYALASLANPNPTAADVEKICKAVNVTVDKATLDFVLESVNGRDVATLVNEGVAKMSAMAASAGPVSGGAAAAAGGAAAPAAAAAKQEEPEEEGDDDMGFGLFD